MSSREEKFSPRLIQVAIKGFQEKAADESSSPRDNNGSTNGLIYDPIEIFDLESVGLGMFYYKDFFETGSKYQVVGVNLEPFPIEGGENQFTHRSPTELAALLSKNFYISVTSMQTGHKYGHEYGSMIPFRVDKSRIEDLLEFLTKNPDGLKFGEGSLEYLF